MSFDKEDDVVFDEAIFPACAEVGFTALRIDRQYLESDVTINDAMIAEIKRSRFCIADFSKHKKGVYFEAGYALGRGIPVIYTCHREYMGDAHFDTKPYQHIVYADLDELKRLLINAIRARITD